MTRTVHCPRPSSRDGWKENVEEASRKSVIVRSKSSGQTVSYMTYWKGHRVSPTGAPTPKLLQFMMPSQKLETVFFGDRERESISR